MSTTTTAARVTLSDEVATYLASIGTADALSAMLAPVTTADAAADAAEAAKADAAAKVTAAREAAKAARDSAPTAAIAVRLMLDAGRTATELRDTFGMSASHVTAYSHAGDMMLCSARCLALTADGQPTASALKARREVFDAVAGRAKMSRKACDALKARGADPVDTLRADRDAQRAEDARLAPTVAQTMTRRLDAVLAQIGKAADKGTLSADDIDALAAHVTTALADMVATADAGEAADAAA